MGALNRIKVATQSRGVLILNRPPIATPNTPEPNEFVPPLLDTGLRLAALAFAFLGAWLQARRRTARAFAECACLARRRQRVSALVTAFFPAFVLAGVVDIDGVWPVLAPVVVGATAANSRTLAAAGANSRRRRGK